MKYKNTLQKGSVRFIIFKEGRVWYGAALEFNIIESGSTPQEAILLLFDAAQGYLASARKVKARPHILNQKPDREYEAMWNNLQKAEPNRTRATSNVYTFGRMNIGQAATRSLVPA